MQEEGRKGRNRRVRRERGNIENELQNRYNPYMKLSQNFI